VAKSYQEVGKLIVTLEGCQGTGKSLTSTALGYTELINNGVKMICNNHLNFPYTHFDRQYFLDHLEDEELENCVLLLDESYLYFDGRTAASKSNKLFTYFTVQTRKRGVDLYICTHHIDILDKRVRRAVDIRGTCRYRKEDPCRQCNGKGWVTAKTVAKYRESKMAMVTVDKTDLPLYVTSSSAYHGRREYKVKDLTTGAKMTLSEDELLMRDGIPDEKWESLFKPYFSNNGNGEDVEDVDREQCPRCLGWGLTGWATTRFLDLRSGKRRRIRVFGPSVFGLYSTEERVPFTKKQMAIRADDL